MTQEDECEIKACLHFARKVIEHGNLAQAERLYRAILKQAEEVNDEGPLTGMVLLDLHEFYEKQNRHDESAPVWERIRRILIRGAAPWQKAES